MIKFFDSHFHIWDTLNDGITDTKIVQGLMSKWDWNDQRKALENLDGTVKLISGIFMEVIPDDNQCINEAWWARKNIKSKKIFLCPRVNLSKSKDYVDTCLNTMCKMDKMVVSIRDILNFEPSWPKIKMNMMENDQWRTNFSLLEKYKLAFDCQANPHQLKSLRLFFAQYPNINVIINHMGTLKDINNRKEIDEWRKGMKELSQLSHIYIKISFLCYVDKENWYEKNGRIHNLVRETLKMFGPSRCMFGSNYPVDLKDDVTAVRLYNAFKMFSEGFNLKDQNQLWKGTAIRAYCLKRLNNFGN